MRRPAAYRRAWRAANPTPNTPRDHGPNPMDNCEGHETRAPLGLPDFAFDRLLRQRSTRGA